MPHQKRKAPVGAFFVLLIILVVICYLVSGVCNIPGVTILNLEQSLKYSFMHPAEAWNEKSPSFMALGLVGWFMIVGWYLTYFRNYHNNPYGSDDWRDVYEANEYYRDKNGDNRVLTQNLEVSLSLRGTLSNNKMAIFASSGCYKTTGLVENNILRFGASYIVLDVKGELKRKWGKAFLRAGYKINTLDFKQPHKSDQYNPFAFIENEMDILVIAEAIHEACRPNKDKSMQDPFWDDAVLLYSQSLYSCEWLRARETGKVGTMNGVMELVLWETEIVDVDEITKKPITRLEAYMNSLADKYGASYPPVRDYRKLKKGAPDTVNSVILMLNGMLKVCETAEVKRIFEGNDINFREFGTGVGGDPNKKSVLFLCVDDHIHVYNWIVSVIYQQSITILSRLSDIELNNTPLPIRVEYWMDEFYNGCRPADVDKLLGIVRSRNMSLVLILQSIAQLQVLYPEKWKVIMDNLAVVVFAGSGPTATETHKYFSELTGKMTVDTRTDNIHHGHNANTADNFNQMGRELMTPTEIRRMPLTDAIVFIEASNPIYDEKRIPFDQPLKGYYAPKVLKKWYSALRSLGEYEHPVYTIYDEVHFHYITVRREMPMQVVTDEKDIEALQQAAIRNPNIYTYNVNEDELLYLSWGGPEYTQENVEEMYNQAMQDAEFRREKLKGLIVLQNVDGTHVPNFGTKPQLTDKTGWERYTTLKSLIAAKWDDLSAPEQEEIYMGIEEGLTEEQLRMLMLCQLVEMARIRQLFVQENRGRG